MAVFAEDELGRSRDRHGEPDGRDHLRDRLGLGEEAEEGEVEGYSQQRAGDRDREYRRRVDGPAELHDQVVVQPGDEERDGAEGEVEHARRYVRHDDARRGYRVDSAEHESGKNEGNQGSLLISRPGLGARTGGLQVGPKERSPSISRRRRPV